jgi:hypothetical protein
MTLSGLGCVGAELTPPELLDKGLRAHYINCEFQQG